MTVEQQQRQRTLVQQKIDEAQQKVRDLLEGSRVAASDKALLEYIEDMHEAFNEQNKWEKVLLALPA